MSIQKSKRAGGITIVCLHDMVRSFCLKKGEEEEFLHVVTGNNFDQDLKGQKIKVAYNFDNLECILTREVDNDDDTHTILCFGHGRSSPMISIGRLLKVNSLFCLRSFALSYVAEVPHSISNLQYLETLIINPRDAIPLDSMYLESLPSTLCLPHEIWTMQHLRHNLLQLWNPTRSGR